MMDVLVVGLGPVGAVLAILLSQRGLKVTVVERDHEVYRLPRAAHFDHEIMRVFQECGLAGAILPHTRSVPAYEFRNAAGEALLRFNSGTGRNPSGWENGYMFFQPGLEEKLRARLKQLRVDVRLGTTLLSLEDRGDHVVAKAADAGGAQSTIEARYVVGCDGASSAVRRMMEIELDDLNFDEPWLVIDAEVRDPEGLPEINLQICDPVRPTTCVLMGPGRHRWEFMLKPGEEVGYIASDESIARLMAPWVRPGQVEIVRRAVYRFHGLVAKSWRRRRVFLAGDSAHQMPPFLGQGMCSGIRDAANLAWKLQMVVKGQADDQLLDTYQQEREPHVREIIGIAIFMGQVVCIQDEQAAAQRDRDMLAKRKAEGDTSGAVPMPRMTAGCVGTDALSGSLFPQVRTTTGELADDVTANIFRLFVRRAVDAERGAEGVQIITCDRSDHLPWIDDDGATAAWLDKHNALAVLVRPDRYVFGIGQPNNLLHQLSRHLRANGLH